MTSYQIITERDALVRACEQWAQAPWIALDTEFVREDTYYPRLCLIQIADASGCTILDALALGEALPALCTVMTAPRVLKVIHAASQDLEVLYRLCGCVPTPLFDTQIAAALLGLGDQISYAALVEKRGGLTLDKSLTRTDWSRRPLSAAELSYAAADVHHLADLFPTLQADIEARGRSEWLLEECEALGAPSRYQSAPEEAWRRVKGIAALNNGGAQACAAALAAWRESTAQRRDRPRRWVLADEALVSVAQRRPQTLEELERLQALTPKALQRDGTALLAALAGVAPNAPELMAASAPLSEGQRRQLSDWQGRLRALALELNIPAPMLASRADLEVLVRAGPEANIGLRRGWRGRVSAGLFDS